MSSISTIPDVYTPSKATGTTRMTHHPSHDGRKGHHYYIRMCWPAKPSYIVVTTLAVVMRGQLSATSPAPTGIPDVYTPSKATGTTRMTHHPSHDGRKGHHYYIRMCWPAKPSYIVVTTLAVVMRGQLSATSPAPTGTSAIH